MQMLHPKAHTMTISTDHPLPHKVVGYIRVSTERQDAEADGLERQAERIRQFCKERGLTLVSIYEDVGSAVADGNSSGRDGLMDAITLANNERAGVLVTDLTRFDRNLLSISESLGRLRVPLFSIRNGGVVDHITVVGYVNRGAVAARNISEGTKLALEGRKNAGVVLGSPSDKTAANKASVKVRAERAAEIVFQVADIMKEDPAYVDLSVPALAKLLNRRGVRSGWGREWTTAAVKRTRKAALEVVQSRIGDDEEAGVATSASDVGQVEALKTPTGADAKATITKATEPQAAQQPDIPGWGDF